MRIRTELEKDYKAVYNLNFEAFGNRENESKLVERIRKSEEFVQELSLVAEKDEEILGHVLISKALVLEEDFKHDVMVLAPVAVDPNYQKQGIGGKLVSEALKRCDQMGVSLVLLIGHPSYYPKFGFKPARKYGLELKQFQVPDEVFMVYEATEGKLNSIKGELVYPKAFFE